MSVAPWSTLRYSFMCLGGRLYALLIAFRLASFAGVAYFTTGYFDELDEVKMGTTTARLIFGAGAAALLVGAAVVFCVTPESHRWTWWACKKFNTTGPAELQWYFAAGQLVNAAQTADEQHAQKFLAAHPSYLKKEPVTDWLLSLDADTILFARSDKKLSPGTTELAGNSLKWFFDDSIARVRYYYKSDDPALQLIVAHLTALAAEIEEREPPAVLLLPPSETAGAAAASAPAEEAPGKAEDSRSPAGAGGGVNEGETAEQRLRARVAQLAREAEAREARGREREGRVRELEETVGEMAREIERLKGGGVGGAGAEGG
jgi:hypothetical protein